MGWNGPMTYRQYLVWKQWLKDEWNRPNRADHYVMDVARRVLQKFNPSASSLQLSDLKIPFNFVPIVPVVEEAKVERKVDWMRGRTPPPIMTKEMIEATRTAMAKARWTMSGVGN